MTDFTKRVVVITGGANGMGEREAHTFAEHGAQVVIIDRDAENTQRVESEVKSAGGRISSIVTDLRDEDNVRNAIAKIKEQYGRIDVIDNNAAALELTANDFDVATTDTQNFVDTLHGDILPAFLMCKYTIPLFLEQGGGVIVNIASVSGLLGESTLTGYGVAKAGVIQLTRALAVQYSKHGIRANAVAPAYVKTPNNKVFAPKQLNDIYKRAMLTPDTVPMQAIADAVLFLASDEAEYITGHTLPVDGGLTASSPIVADYRDWQASV